MKKRKRSSLEHVFVTDEPIIDGNERNLTPPEGVTGVDGQVIEEPEAVVFFIIRLNFFCFQRKQVQPCVYSSAD